MFEWLPDVCRELRDGLIQVYWTLLVPYVVLMICLDFFRMPEAPPNAGRIIKRAFVSVLLLISFEESMNMLAMLSDGVTEQINGIYQLKDLLKHLGDEYANMEVSWLRAREAILYIMNLIAYIIAYLGVFVADVIVHFVWAILYVVSPLMILMYVSERTAFVTNNLYKGLINVISWKILWSILGALLLKMAISSEAAASDNFLLVVLLNLCIGLSMLFVPFVAKSLVNDGLSGMASMMAAAPSAAALGALKVYGGKFAKSGMKEVATGLSGTRQAIGRGYKAARDIGRSVPSAATKTREASQKAIQSFKAKRSKEWHPRPPGRRES